jgi:hypothetical protein
MNIPPLIIYSPVGYICWQSPVELRNLPVPIAPNNEGIVDELIIQFERFFTFFNSETSSVYAKLI